MIVIRLNAEIILMCHLHMKTAYRIMFYLFYTVQNIILCIYFIH
jgi:hypothetical protein